MEYSQHQKNVFDSISDKAKQHITVQATAGSGKTTTILGALKFIPLTKKAIFLSFSNSIVNELKAKVPSHIKASTLHSLGCRMIMKQYKVKVDENKYFQLALDTYSKKERTKKVFKSCNTIKDICNFARMTLTNFKEDELKEMANHF